MTATAASSFGRRATSRRGFTLVELITVLVIIGIAAGIVVPMLGNTGDIDTAAAARRLSSDLLYAQNYAITHQTRVRVTFNTALNQYMLVAVPSDGPAEVLTHPVTRRPFVVAFTSTDGLEKVRLSETDFAGDATQVDFDSLGAPDKGGSITLTCGGKQKVVSLAPITGKVTVQ